MKNANAPAFPVPLSEGEYLLYGQDPNGLTKREHFAAMAMQGLLASWGQHDVTEAEEITWDAVEFADALLARLEHTNQKRN